MITLEAPLNPQFWQALEAYIEGRIMEQVTEPEQVKAEPRKVYFIMETERTQDGQYIPCIAVEGEKGFYRTDWAWGTDKEQARALCNERNEKMGITPREATRIQFQTMF